MLAESVELVEDSKYNGETQFHPYGAPNVKQYSSSIACHRNLPDESTGKNEL
jgi:hypothetical protein